MSDPKLREQTAKTYLETKNISETARRMGIHRATVQRWLKEPDFLTGAETNSLSDLLPKALEVLESALDGKKITQAQIRAALEVVKTQNSLKKDTEGEQSLADIIAALDSEEKHAYSD